MFFAQRHRLSQKVVLSERVRLCTLTLIAPKVDNLTGLTKRRKQHLERVTLVQIDPRTLHRILARVSYSNILLEQWKPYPAYGMDIYNDYTTLVNDASFESLSQTS